MFTTVESLARKRALIVIGSVAALSAIIPPFMSIEIDYYCFLVPFVVAAVIAAPLPYMAWRKLSSQYAACECLALSLCSLLPVLILTYCAMRFNFPLADELLAAADGSLGFSTPAIIKAVYALPLLGKALAFSYGTLLWQSLAIPVLLCSGGHIRRCYQYMAACILLTVIATACSIPFPSYGAMVGQGADPLSYPCSALQLTYHFIGALEHVRNDAVFVLNEATADGIITFPSIHAGTAAIFMWATWPSRVFRYPVIGLNVLMMISAIACGSHYLVDVLAGNALVFVTVKLVTSAPGRWPGWSTVRRLGSLVPA